MPDTQVQNVTVTIDGQQVSVPKGTLLVEAAKQVQKDIPVYCYHSKLGPAGLCRICLVEVEGMPKLQIACNTPVNDGMVVHTFNDKVDDGRRAVLEFLLLNHPLDCPICDKGGECDLQDFSMAYGQSASRLAEPKVPKPKAVDLGPTIVLDEERCIVCQRCVRFDDIITRERSLVVKDRGHKDIIATATEEPYRSNFSGNVTELCPVGALTSKTYRFKSRPWDLHRTTTSCMQCSVGCQMHADERLGAIARVMSVEQDDAISDGWLCDRGRYNLGYPNDERRITTPMYKVDGSWTQIGWDDALDLWAKAIKAAAPERIAVLGGGRLLNEEAFLLQHTFRQAGVRNLDWRGGRQRHATPPKGGTLVELESAEVIIVAGEGPAEMAPIMDLRIRKAVHRKGATLIRINNADARAQIPSTDVRTAREAIAAIPQGKSRIAVAWDGVDSSLAQELTSALPDALMYIAGEQPNARGAEAMGMLPQDGRDFLTLMQTPELDVLCIFGANPVLHAPNGPQIEAAFQKIPFVVVSELFMTATAQAATLVLPARSAFEKTGTTTNLAGDVLPVNAALPSPEGVLSDLEMIALLGERLGVALPSFEEMNDQVLRALANGDGSTILRTRKDTAMSPRGNDNLKIVVRSSIFSGGGTAAHDRRIETLRPLPEAAISPETARRLDLREGDCVDLSAGDRTMHDLLVEVRDNIPDDVVVLVNGLPDGPANALGDAQSTTITNVRRANELAGAGV